LNAQENTSFKELFNKLYSSENDSVTEIVNSKILKLFETEFISNNLNYFDTVKIKNLSIAASSDKKLIVYTWSVKKFSEKIKYYGFINYFIKNRGKFYLEPLNFNTEIITGISENIIYPNNWYGAQYYNLIEKKIKRAKYYVLLGWNANDDFTNKKIIDNLFINEDDEIVFGKPIFEVNGKKISRFVFEYGERLSMNLKYDKKNDLIFWDHLSPSKPELVNSYSYYGPDLSFDGLKYEKGIWQFIEDIQF
jgi:hypothetical protein